jgi:hypothetical protein
MALVAAVVAGGLLVGDALAKGGGGGIGAGHGAGFGGMAGGFGRGHGHFGRGYHARRHEGDNSCANTYSAHGQPRIYCE